MANPQLADFRAVCTYRSSECVQVRVSRFFIETSMTRGKTYFEQKLMRSGLQFSPKLN